MGLFSKRGAQTQGGISYDLPTGVYNLPVYPGPDPYSPGPVDYRLSGGMPGPDIDATIGGGFGGQAQNRRNIATIGGGDTAYYNVGLSCFKVFHYQERPLPGRRYLAWQPVLGFSRWLR